MSPTTQRDSHVYQHNDDKPRFSVKIEHNSRGTNWEVGVSNVMEENLRYTISVIEDTDNFLKRKYAPDAPDASDVLAS